MLGINPGEQMVLHAWCNWCLCRDKCGSVGSDCFWCLLLQQCEGGCPLWGAQGFAITQLVFFSLWDSRWVFHTSEREERWFSGNIGLAPYSTLSFLWAFLQSSQQSSSWLWRVSESTMPQQPSQRSPAWKISHTIGAWESSPGTSLLS